MAQERSLVNPLGVATSSGSSPMHRDTRELRKRVASFIVIMSHGCLHVTPRSRKRIRLSPRDPGYAHAQSVTECGRPPKARGGAVSPAACTCGSRRVSGSRDWPSAGGMAKNDNFDASSYLQKRYVDLNDLKTKGVLDHLHHLFGNLGKDKDRLKVLDYGSGPAVQNCISVAARASEIVFSDISSANREAIQKWLDGGADAFNWSPHFDYVVKTLEGKGEKEAREREQRVRQISKVAFCDALSETPIEKGYKGPYDVILQFSCLESACSNKESYITCMKVLTSLLKPGGMMINSSSNGLTNYEGLHYRVGERDQACIRLTTEYVVSVFEECGFEDIGTALIPLNPNTWLSNTLKATANGLHFIYGTKK